MLLDANYRVRVLVRHPERITTRQCGDAVRADTQRLTLDAAPHEATRGGRRDLRRSDLCWARETSGRGAPRSEEEIRGISALRSRVTFGPRVKIRVEMTAANVLFPFLSH